MTKEWGRNSVKILQQTPDYLPGVGRYSHSDIAAFSTASTDSAPRKRPPRCILHLSAPLRSKSTPYWKLMVMETFRVVGAPPIGGSVSALIDFFHQ
jgi:hypothetical protein